MLLQFLSFQSPCLALQEMNVEGLTRENVASHLQKWRVLVKNSEEGTQGSRHPDPGGTQ